LPLWLQVTSGIALLSTFVLLPITVALLQFRSSKDSGGAALTTAAMTFVTEIQEERDGWKKVADGAAADVRQLRTDLSNTQRTLQETQKLHATCQTEVAELRALLDKKVDKDAEQ
jgi:hypothetical protein